MLGSLLRVVLEGVEGILSGIDGNDINSDYRRSLVRLVDAINDVLRFW